jgi:hypothetical protein
LPVYEVIAVACSTYTSLIQASSVNDIIDGPSAKFSSSTALTPPFAFQHRHYYTAGTDEAVEKAEGTAHLMGSQAVNDVVSFENKGTCHAPLSFFFF